MGQVWGIENRSRTGDEGQFSYPTRFRAGRGYRSPPRTHPNMFIIYYLINFLFFIIKIVFIFILYFKFIYNLYNSINFYNANLIYLKILIHIKTYNGYPTGTLLSPGIPCPVLNGYGGGDGDKIWVGYGDGKTIPALNPSRWYPYFRLMCR